MDAAWRIYTGQSQILYTAEGRNSSVAISRWSNGTIYVNVNGHVEATTEPFDMKLQRMVGHLPGLLHPNPKSVLGIGFGAGVSAGTFTRYPGIEKITVCEIEPVIPPASTRYFAQQDYDVYHNPRTHIVYDDARHYLLTTNEKFDIIASDPLDVFVKGTAALYSKEYFEAVKQPSESRRHVHALCAALRDRRAHHQERAGDLLPGLSERHRLGQHPRRPGLRHGLHGQAEPLKIDLDEVAQRLERPDYAPVAESLRDIGVPLVARSVCDLCRAEVGSGTLDERRADQPRCGSAPVLPGRLGNQFRAGRCALSPDAALPAAAG